MDTLEVLKQKIDEIEKAHDRAVDQQSDLIVLAKERFILALKDIDSWDEVDWKGILLEINSSGTYFSSADRYFVYKKDKKYSVSLHRDSSARTISYVFKLNKLIIYDITVPDAVLNETIDETIEKRSNVQEFRNNEHNLLFRSVVQAIDMKHLIETKTLKLDGAQANLNDLTEALGVKVDAKRKEAYSGSEGENSNKVNDDWEFYKPEPKPKKQLFERIFGK